VCVCVCVCVLNVRVCVCDVHFSTRINAQLIGL
jgi:hypothetical protein